MRLVQILVLLLCASQAFAVDPPSRFNISGQLDDVGTTNATENSYTHLRITAPRALHTNLRNNSGVETGTAGTPLRIDPTGTTNQPVTQATSPWLTSRNWTLLNSTDSVNAVQSGTWTVQQGSTPTAVGNAWPVKLTDGTNTTAVKAASTAPVAADPAAVVVVSPNGNQATAANQVTQITSLQIIDDLPHTNDSALVKGAPIMGQLDDVSTGTVTENNVSTVRITGARAEHVNLRDNSGAEIGIPTNTIRSTPQYKGSVARFLDMNAANGGVARGTGIASTTVFTTIYNYTGSGNLFSFTISLEGNLIGGDSFTIKLEIDSAVVFEIETVDVGTGNLWNFDALGDEATMGMSMDQNNFRFIAPRSGSLFYASNIKVSVKKTSSASSKQFRAGAIYLTKET